MLMMVGPVILEIAPFNLTDYTHTHGGAFAEKPVMGARQPLEWMGRINDKLTALFNGSYSEVWVGY